jgi:hypothetical protein
MNSPKKVTLLPNKYRIFSKHGQRFLLKSHDLFRNKVGQNDDFIDFLTYSSVGANNCVSPL